MEDVHDEVDEVEQHPAALRRALRRDAPASPSFFISCHHVLADRAHVRVRRAAGDDEEVGHVGDAAQVEQHDVVALCGRGRSGRRAGRARRVGVRACLD